MFICPALVEGKCTGISMPTKSKTCGDCYNIYLWFYLHSLLLLYFAIHFPILFNSSFTISITKLFYFQPFYYSAFLLLSFLLLSFLLFSFLLFSLLLLSFSIIQPSITQLFYFQLYYSAIFLLV